MDFVANGSKNVEIETSTGVYLRHAIQTHFVEIGEDYIELVNRYVKPLYEEGDLLSISEKIIALCQKRVVYRKDMKISWLAKFLSRFAIQHNSAGIGVGECARCSSPSTSAGVEGPLWAAICAGFGKLVGKHGIFYDMVGMEVTGLDYFLSPMCSPSTATTASVFRKILGACKRNEIYEKTGVRAMIVDANDFTRDILGKGDNVTSPTSNCVRSSAITPRVRDDQCTPFILIRKNSNFPCGGSVLFPCWQGNGQSHSLT